MASAARPSGDSSSLADAAQSCACRSGSTASTAPSLQRHHQRRVQLGAEAERLHRRQRLHRLHVGQPGPAAAVERQVEAAEALVDLGHLAEDAHPLGPVVGRFELRVERADQLVEIAAAPVDRLEDHRHAGALVGVVGHPLEGADRRRRVARGGRAGEDLGVAIDGAGGVADPVGQDLRQAQRGGVLVGAQRLAVEAGVQVIGQVRPAAGLRQQSFQLGGRLAIGRIDLQRLAQRPDGAVRVIELLFVQLGAAAQERDARRGVRRPAGLLVDELAQLRPGPPALERRFVELRRRAIVGARVEEAPVVLLRLGALSQAQIEDLGGPAHDVEHRRLFVQLAVEVAGEQARRVLPAIELVGQAQERLGGLPLRRRLLEDLPVPAKRAVEVLQLLFVEPRDPLGPAEPFGRILDLQQANLANLDERLPVAAPRVDRLEQRGRRPLHAHVVEHPLEHGDGARVIGRARENELQVLQRRLAIAAPIVLDLRQAEAEVDQLLLRPPPPLQEVAEQANQIAPALGLRVEAIERRGGRAIGGRDLDDPLVGGDRVVEPFELGLRQLADLDAQRALDGRLLGQLRAPQEDLVEGLRVAVAAIDRVERGQRAVVVGDAIEDAAVVVGRGRRVTLPRRRGGDGAIETELERLVEDVGADVAVERGDLGQALGAGQALVGVEQRRELRLGQGVADGQRRRLQRPLGVAEPRLFERRQPHQLAEARADVGLRPRRRCERSPPARRSDRPFRRSARAPARPPAAGPRRCRAPGSAPAPPAPRRRPAPVRAPRASARARPSRHRAAPPAAWRSA